MEQQIRIRFQPRQYQFLEAVERSGEGCPTNIGYGGSRGGAKSGAIRRVMLQRRFDHPGTDGWIVRRTFPRLQDNHIEQMWREYPYLEQLYSTKDKAIVLPRQEGTDRSSRILFRYAETTKDVKQLIGPETMDMAVDQAEQFTQEELEYLRSNVRWPGKSKGSCKFLMAFNPGGKGAAYLKRIFIDGQKDHSQYTNREKASDFTFVQAYGWDNIEWVRPYLEQIGVSDVSYYRDWTEQERRDCFLAHSDYGQWLNSLGTSLRQAWLEGTFDKFAGQFFSNFEPERVVRRYQELKVEPWHTRWVSVDWGFAHNASVHWHAKTATHTVTYREFVRHKLGQRALAQEIIERSQGESIAAVYLSPDAFARRQNEMTIADQMADVLASAGLPRPRPADNDRVSGWRLMYELMGWKASPEEHRKEQPATWLICDQCPRLLAAIPQAQHGEIKAEDIEKFDCDENGEGGDDCLDDVRYGLKSRYQPEERPEAEIMHERVIALTEPQDRYMQLLANTDQQRKSRYGVPLR